MILHQVDPKTIGQYTGLKDKNGKEICGGDIVKAYMYDQSYNVMVDISHLELIGNYEVYYSNNDCLYSLRKKNDDWSPNSIGCFPVIEVIGNIYDNSELLENDR